MAWDLSCKDWESRIRAGRSLIPDQVRQSLNREEAEIAVAFFDQLRLPDVPGNPQLLEAAGQWARDIVYVIFGSWFPELGQRFIEEIFALVGKKNSKTTYLGAGLMLTALFMNRRPRAEFLFGGPTQAIADLAYSQADGMIGLDPELRKRFKRREHKKEIEDLDIRAKLKIKTFDLNILTGPRPAGAFIDELHLLGRKPDTPRILRQLRGGRQSVPESFLVIATTQSDEPPAGAFRDELMAARAVRDGKRSGTMLPILYEFPDAVARDREQWSDPKNWPMVMPNLGKSLRLDSLFQDYETETEKGEQAIQLWASQHLNIEIGIGLKSDRWAGADYWPGAAEPGVTLESVIERSEVVVIGSDNGGKDDMFSVGVMGREKGTGRWLFWARAWLHRDAFEQRKSEASRWRDLEAAGDLVVVDHLMDAVFEATEIIERVNDSGLLPEVNAIGLDELGIAQLANELSAREFVHPRVVSITQGYRLGGPIKTAEVALDDGILVHGGQPLMTYAVGNCKVEPRGNGIIITKQASGTAKIDPAIALFNCVALMSKNPTAGTNVYRGIYSDPEAYSRVFGKKTAAPLDNGEIDFAILQDMSHPLFAEHKARFERRQDAEFAREGADW